MNLEVRPATENEFDILRKIATQCLADFCPEQIGKADIESWSEQRYSDDTLRKCLSDSDSSINTMVDNDRPVGFCMMKLRPDDRRIGQIDPLVVTPEHKNHNSVFKLFQQTIKPRIDAGMTEVEINIPECARPWIDIYTRIGLEFEPWRKFEDYIGKQKLIFWPGMLVIVPGC